MALFPSRKSNSPFDAGVQSVAKELNPSAAAEQFEWVKTRKIRFPGKIKWKKVFCLSY